MSETRIPGVNAHHSIIREECRIGRSDGCAWSEAVARAEHEYVALINGWPIGKGATIHLVLTIEIPDAAMGKEAAK